MLQLPGQPRQLLKQVFELLLVARLPKVIADPAPGIGRFGGIAELLEVSPALDQGPMGLPHHFRPQALG